MHIDAANQSTDYESTGNEYSFGWTSPPTQANTDGMEPLPPAHHASSVLEKVLEHRFVAELTTALWRSGIRDFDILRSEVDFRGHDLVIEARGIMRHIQLKTLAVSSTTRDVAIVTQLGERPSGCVVWMVHDPESLTLGPFLWFGGAAGQPLPDLGDRTVRHSRGNALGEKAVRPGLRKLGIAKFEPVATMDDLVLRLFERRSWETDPSLSILVGHMARGEGGAMSGWLGEVARGNFEYVPQGLDWDNAIELAHLVDGYELLAQLGVDNGFAFADERLAYAQKAGSWSGPAHELWICLFLEYRRWKFAGAEPEGDARILVDILCRQLAESLCR